MKFDSRPSQFSSQAGVTLLLSILVLAAITAIAFSLAAIILIEIRASGDVTRTEPALYAVQGVIEEAFYKYQRQVGDSLLDIATGDSSTDSTGCVQTNVCGTSGQATFNGVSINPLPAARRFDPAPRIDTIPANTTTNYLFIDPTRPNDFGTKVYNSISFTALNSVINTSAVVYKCCDTAGNTITVQTYSLPANTTNTYTISDNLQYILAITNSNANSPLLVQIDAIKATAVNGQTHVLPLLGKVLDINASYLGLTRKYSVTVPVNNISPGAGLASNFLVDTNNSLSTGLVSYWKLDEASGTRADSKGTNNLPSTNGVGQTAGKQGSSAHITAASSQYLSTADNASLSSGDIDFTVAAWAYIDSLGATRYIVAKSDGTFLGEYGLQYFFGNNRFRFFIQNNNGTFVAASANSVVPALNTWYFIVGWHDSVANTVNIQVNNGTVDSVPTAGIVPVDSTQAFDIGSRSDSSTFWDGRIDEVGFWKRVLSAQERIDLYNSGNGNTCSGGC